MNKSANIEKRVGATNPSENKQKVVKGVLFGLSFLAAVAFWATFAYSLVTGNVKLATTFGQIIGVMVAVYVPIHIAYTLYKKISKV